MGNRRGWFMAGALVYTGTLVCMGLGLPALARAQTTGVEQTPNDTLVSPEVMPDHRVVFRIYAPKAVSVTIRGDWMPSRGVVKLEKDGQGVWSTVEGPLKADFYSYTFTVDGVKITDPKNGMIKPGVRGIDSMLEVPGTEAEFEAARPVPHGEVRMVWYQSSTLDTLRRMHVYTPPGYDTSREKYPVFYLLHGGGDDDAGWSTIGRANFILDNLLAAKKVKPMIVVMPNGSLPSGPASVTPGGPHAQDRFANEMLNDVVPFVEKHYRVLANRDNRAIAGLSMGGSQTQVTAFRHPEEFAYIGIWSSGTRPEFNEEYQQLNAAFLDSPDKTNKQVKLLWIGVGKEDPLAYKTAQNLLELLKSHQIKYEYHESEGAHTWINWRRYLNDYAQILFR